MVMIQGMKKMTEEEIEEHKENIAKITSLLNKINEIIHNENNYWQTNKMNKISGEEFYEFQKELEIFILNKDPKPQILFPVLVSTLIDFMVFCYPRKKERDELLDVIIKKFYDAMDEKYDCEIKNIKDEK